MARAAAMGRLALALVALLLAGCVGEPTPSSRPTLEPVLDDPPMPRTNATPAPAGVGAVADCFGRPCGMVETVRLDLNGTLGLGADACVFGPTTTCAPEAYAVPSQRELSVSGKQGAVTAAHVTLSWSAATPATATLGIGLMTMGPRDCNCTTMLGQAKGPSPLTLTFANKNVTLAPGAVLHLFVYTIPQSAGPGYAYADEPQAFRVEGTAMLVKV